jgi:hypothetical protein
MKRSKGLLIASSSVVAVAVLLAMAYQPFRITKATSVDDLAVGVNFNASFFDEAVTIDPPSSATDYCGKTAEENMKSLINHNKIAPFKAFDLLGQSGFTGSRKVQGCALGFSGWNMIYGAQDRSLPHPFRIQKITDTKPDFVPFGFFMGVHGIRKIAFQGYSMTMPISSSSQTQLGYKNLAVCLADLDGTNMYNLDLENTAPTSIIEVETTGGVWKYTFILPKDKATDWTPRWIYVAGAFFAVNFHDAFGTTNPDDYRTYFNDLYSVEVWFDATC